MSIHTQRWHVDIALAEDGDHTRAGAHLHTRDNTSLHSVGRARRSPHDPAVPEIGDELATARALADLAHQLLDAAGADISAITHEDVILTH